MTNHPNRSKAVTVRFTPRELDAVDEALANKLAGPFDYDDINRRFYENAHNKIGAARNDKPRT